jgi:hypothetical protein
MAVPDAANARQSRMMADFMREKSRPGGRESSAMTGI